jgi:adenylate cyclase, class 2
MALEFEVKFQIAKPQRLRERILSLGADSQGRTFERNLCFDTPGGALKRRGRLLRLRQDAGVHLTYKAPPEDDQQEVKVYREIELSLDSFGAMAAVLTELGFRPVKTYEKWRETFTSGEIHFCLDEMPFGHFLEIEGPLDTIRPQAARLGLNWSERILIDYLAIFAAVRAVAGPRCPEPTFSACANLDPLPSSFWRRLQAG